MDRSELVVGGVYEHCTSNTGIRYRVTAIGDYRLLYTASDRGNAEDSLAIADALAEMKPYVPFFRAGKRYRRTDGTAKIFDCRVVLDASDLPLNEGAPAQTAAGYLLWGPDSKWFFVSYGWFDDWEEIEDEF